MGTFVEISKPVPGRLSVYRPFHDKGLALKFIRKEVRQKHSYTTGNQTIQKYPHKKLSTFWLHPFAKLISLCRFAGKPHIP
jgi:hypothetical protein